jgi:hypothetical protein
MFGKLLTIGCAVLLSTALFAKEEKINKIIVCDTAENMLPWFDEKYGEEPMWIGVVKEATAEDEPVYASVVLNTETQTWTIVMYNRKVSCILESGTGFKFKFPKTGSL